MSFKLGGSQSTSSGTATDNYTKTSTPNVPDWLLQPTQQLATRLTGMFGTDPSTLVPGADPLQTQAANSAANLGSPWNFDAALQTTRDMVNTQTPQAQAAQLTQGLDKYYNPFQKQVIDPVVADQNANADRVRSQQALNLAGSGAFGGSGAALTQSQTEGELQRARDAALSPLYQADYNTALTASNEDAARRQQNSQFNSTLSLQDQQQKEAGAAQLAALAAAKDQNASANIGTQEAAGAVNRGIATDQAQAPFNFQTWLEQALQGLNPSLYTGQTQTGTDTQYKTGKGSNMEASVGFTYGGGKSGG